MKARLQASPASPQNGLSLIELMVAITLGLMITTTLGYILVGSRATYRTQDASARVQDTGRFALEHIGRQIRLAGRVDITPLFSDGRTSQPVDMTPITGTNSAAQLATGGTPATRQVDTITIQYQLSDVGGGAIEDCNGFTVAGVPIPGGLNYGTIINALSLDVDPSDGNIRELECDGNGGAPQPFAEEVEDLQFRYAESNAPNVFNDTPANWNNVVAVEVCIMVRSSGNGVVTAAQSIRDCTGTNFTPGDMRLRRTFISVFTLRNRVRAIP